MNLSKSKSVLAKLLAEENIIVQHKNVSTAYFELKSRTLVCPTWKDMSEELYDLLMAHEVGHALFTPAQGWHTAIDLKKSFGFKTYLNVIEDARIEKLIKGKFPGLRKSFYIAYNTLYNNDFFGIQKYNISLNKLPLIDRINLHFKVGSFLNVVFTSEEQLYVDKVSKCNTWQEVESLANEIYDYAKNTETILNLDDLLEMLEKDGDDLDLQDQDLESFVGSEPIPESITDRAFRDREKELNLNSDGEETIYLTLPTVNWRSRVIGYKTVYKNMQLGHEISNKYNLDKIDVEENRLLAEFKKKNEKYVAYIVKEFELRKNARQFARAKSSKTGELDTKKIFSYKIVDDLFKRVTTIPNGKNHGLIMVIDFSMSMGDSIKATIEQTIILAMFCRKVNIPFCVYSFTNAKDHFKEIPRNNDILVPFIPNWKEGNPKFISGSSRPFRMREYISSTMSSREFKIALKRLLLLSKTYTPFEVSKTNFVTPISDLMCSTPLDQSIITTIELVKEFKKNNRLDVVSTIFLTDGDSDRVSSYHTETSSYGEHIPSKSIKIMTDPVTKLQGVAKSGQGVTSCCLSLLKQLTGSNVIGFFLSEKNIKLSASKYVREYSDGLISNDDIQKIRKQKFYEIKGGGYDSFFILPGGKSLEMDETGMEVSPIATKNDIKKAFMRLRNKKNVNRMFLNRFSELIC